MNSPFNYNDDAGSKLVRSFFVHAIYHPLQRVAGEAIITGLLPQLKAEDRLAIVLFDDKATTMQDMTPVGSTDIAALKAKLQAMRTRVRCFRAQNFELSFPPGRHRSQGWHRRSGAADQVAEGLGQRIA